MALNDFTGQNIQDTYQKVVQTDGTNLADGTGSLLPISFDGNNVTISGSLTANEYIVSSSVTNITIATLSGSTEFGDTTDDTHTFIGNITASGNISASGTSLITAQDLILDRQLTVPTITNVNTTHVTASGNISASGYLYGSRAIVNRIQHNNSVSDIYFANGINVADSHITASGNISSSGTITQANGLVAGAGRLYFSEFGGSNIYFIKAGNNLALANGGLTTSQITASGNISASGEIIGIINGGTF